MRTSSKWVLSHAGCGAVRRGRITIQTRTQPALAHLHTRRTVGASYFPPVIRRRHSIVPRSPGVVRLVAGAGAAALPKIAWLIFAAGLSFQAKGQSLNTIRVGPELFSDRILAVSGDGSVAVGDAGAGYFSGNGSGWSRVQTGAEATLAAVEQTPSGYLAVGLNGTILTSADGTAWTKRASGVASPLACASSGGGMLLVGGSAGRIVTSTDGAAWTAGGTGSIAEVTGLAYGNNVHVAVCESGEIFSSSNGTAWTKQTSPATGALSAVAFSGGQFIAVGAFGEIHSSVDGAAWTVRHQSGTGRLRAVAAVSSGWVAVGDGGVVLASPDGTAWSATSLPGSPDLVAVAETDGALVAFDFAGGIWNSSGGWHLANAGSSRDYRAVAANDAGVFVAVGSGRAVAVSGNGTAWTHPAAPTTADLNAVAHGNGRFAAVGENGAVLVSPDGNNWVAQPPPTTANLLGIIYGTAGFVAVGQGGACVRSADGFAWTASAITGSADDFHAVAFGNGTYVAVGRWGRIATSADGVAWTIVPDHPTEKERWLDFTGIAFREGVFVATTREWNSFTSPDGVAWTRRTAAMVPGRDFHGVVSLGDRFAAFGDGGAIETSPDGVAWTSQARSTSNPIRAAAFSPGLAVLVGDRGTILATQRGISENPVSVTINEGQNGALSVAADGLGPFTYQWFRGVAGDTSNPVAGATGPTLDVNPGSDGAAYWVRVSDPSGAFDSAAAAIRVRRGWTAYHDTITQADNAANVTNGDPTTDVSLLNFSTGAAIPGVTIRFAKTIGTGGGLKTDANSGSPTLGGDAAVLFGGVIGFGSQVWDLGKNTGTATITISGLNPNKTYDLAIFATRDNFASQTKFVLSGAASFAASHSPGYLIVGGTPAGVEVAIATGDGSTVAGRVARWTELVPAAGGTLTVTVTSPNPALNSCLLPQAIRLAETSESPVVLAGPQSGDVVAGSAVNLSASVVGSGVACQWFRRDVSGVESPVAGATTPELSIASLDESAQYFLRASASGVVSDSPAATLIATRTFPAWAAKKGLPVADPADDHDGDGLANLVEYALGSDPVAETPAPVLAFDDRLRLVFEASKEASGITIAPECSATLAEGSWAAATLERRADKNFATETWEASAPAGVACAFLRLRVSQP